MQKVFIRRNRFAEAFISGSIRFGRGCRYLFCPLSKAASLGNG